MMNTNNKQRLNDLQQKIAKCDQELVDKKLPAFVRECIERDRSTMQIEFNNLAGIKIY